MKHDTLKNLSVRILSEGKANDLIDWLYESEIGFPFLNYKQDSLLFSALTLSWKSGFNVGKHMSKNTKVADEPESEPEKKPAKKAAKKKK